MLIISIAESEARNVLCAYVQPVCLVVVYHSVVVNYISCTSPASGLGILGIIRLRRVRTRIPTTKPVFSHTKHLQINQPTYLYNSLSFPSHSVSTRSSDSLVLSIPYVRSSKTAKGLSLSSVHASGIQSPLIPETHLLYQYSVPDSKHTSSKLMFPP